MSEENVNENIVEDDIDVDDIDIGQESPENDDNLDENETEEQESDTSEEQDESDEGNDVKLTKEEYNQLMMSKRLLEKMSKEESKKDDKPAEKKESVDPFSKLKEKYPDMDDDSLNTLVDVVSEIAGTQFKDVVEQTTEQRIKSDIQDYAQANGLDSEATRFLSDVAVKPEVKQLLVNNVIDIEQLEILAYGKQWKEEAAKLRVSKENGARKKNVHSETKSKGQSKDTSSKKSVKDMTWEEFDAYEKSLGIEY